MYLRARFYSPDIARFVSKDEWEGDINQPMSFNKWLYVNGNPINYSDPSGYRPCVMVKENTNKDRYCWLDKGGFIDTHHLYGGYKMARDLIEKLLPARFGKENAALPLSQTLIGPVRFPLTYKTSLPSSGLPRAELIQVALGIYMDFQYRYEGAQGVDPRCWWSWLNKKVPHCSSFSNEDLISDYLGFVLYAKHNELGGSDDTGSFNQMITLLGGGEAHDEPFPGILGGLSQMESLNYDFFLFHVLVGCDPSVGHYVQRPLSSISSVLIIEPKLEYWTYP